MGADIFEWIYRIVFLGVAIVPIVFSTPYLNKIQKANRRFPIVDTRATIQDKRVVKKGIANVFSAHYATFALPDGQRIELEVTGPAFGQMVAGDTGMLTLQGTCFHRFVRPLEVGIGPVPTQVPARIDASLYRNPKTSHEAANVVAIRTNRSTVPASHFATFELADGRRIELLIDKSTAKRIKPGDFGTLVWQGMRFNNYHREEPR